MKTYLLFADPIENPLAEELPDVEVVYLGIGKSSAVAKAKELCERIENEREECRIFHTGTCGSFTRDIGTAIFDSYYGPSEYLRSSDNLITVDELVPADKSQVPTKILEADAFDMEMWHVAGVLKDPANPYIVNYSCVKIVSDKGVSKISEWEKSVQSVHANIRSVIDWYLSKPALEVKKQFRVYPDFPKPGVDFVDIFPAMQASIIERFRKWLEKKTVKTDLVCPETRGLLLGAAILANSKARYLLIPVRKAGKLPGEVLRFKVVKEYGEDYQEISVDHLKRAVSESVFPLKELKVIIVDDVLATGGTVDAIAEALHSYQGDTKFVVDGFYFFTEIPDLNGRERLSKYAVPVEVFMPM